MEPISRRRFLGYGIAAGGLGAGGGLSALLEACTPGSQQSSGSSSPIKIGLLAPTSGVFADFGDLMSKATNLAVETMNQSGGILGRQLKIVQEDDTATPNVAAERARKLLLSDNVDILMGTVDSASTLAVLPVVNQARKVFVYPLDGEDKTCTSSRGTNPLVFGMGDTPQQRLSQFVPAVVQQSGNKWYFLGNDYVFPHSVIDVAKGYLAQAGGTVVKEEYVPLGTADYSPIIDRIAASGAQVIFSVTVGTDGVAFTKRATESGLSKRVTVTGVATFAPEVYGGLKGLAQGVVTADRYTEAADNEANRTFVSKFRQKYNYTLPLGGTAAACYGALFLWREAAKKANSFEPTKFAKAMEGLKLTLPQGDVEVDANSHLLKQHIYELKITNDRYDIVKDFGQLTHPDHEGCSVK